MPGININEYVVQEVNTSDGQKLEKGDVIVIRVRDEDIACTYQGLDRTYFVTKTLDGAKENRYRFASIQDCRKVNIQILDKEDTDNGKE